MRKAFVNGRIRTIDTENTLVEAMICEDGKISALGTTEEIEKLAQGCDIIDLEGKDIFTF